MIIKVLGPGCSKCVEAYEIVSKAVAASGSDATVEKITDLREIMALGVLATPAVVIDGGIMCTGRVPSAEEVRGWLGASPFGGHAIPREMTVAQYRRCLVCATCAATMPRYRAVWRTPFLPST